MKRITIVIVALLLIISSRTPNIIMNGRFWAEEGSVYFLEAQNNSGINFLFSSNLGYYSLFNKVVMLFTVNIFDINSYPIVTVLFSILVLISVAILFMISEIKELSQFKYKILALGIILFIQPNHEVWLNTINSQFYLAIGTAIILISYSHNKWTNIYRMLFLIIAGFTGVVSCFLAPFFFIKWFRERNKTNLIELVIMSICSFIQLVIVILNSQREIMVDFTFFPYIMFTKQILLPVFGPEFTNNIAGSIYRQIIVKGFFTYWLIILSCVYYILISVIVKAKSKNALFLFCASLWITFLSYVGAIENTDNIKLVSNLYSSTAERYCLVPNVLLFLSIVVVLPIYVKRYYNSRSILTTITLLFCITYFTAGMFIGVKDYFSTKYYSYFFEGPSWQKEISKWRKDRSYKIMIWPEGWNIELNNRNAIKKVSK